MKSLLAESGIKSDEAKDYFFGSLKIALGLEIITNWSQGKISNEQFVVVMKPVIENRKPQEKSKFVEKIKV